MLDHLKKRNVYRNVYCSRIGGGHKLRKVADNTYDIITISGGYAQAHMPVDSLREVARMLKPGGLFVNIMTEQYLKTVEALGALEPLMKTMET